MSWSVHATGRPAEIRETIAQQFKSSQEYLKQGLNQHEFRTCLATEQIVKDELDFVEAKNPEKRMYVQCAGSAWANETDGGTSIEITLREATDTV